MSADSAGLFVGVFVANGCYAETADTAQYNPGPFCILFSDDGFQSNWAAGNQATAASFF